MTDTTARAEATSLPVAERVLSSRIGSTPHPAGRRLVGIAATLPDVIALGRGDPDLPTPAHIGQAAKQAIDDGQTHYTPYPGIDALRREIAAKLRRENGIEVDPASEVVVTTGTQEGLFALCLALLDPGDEILVADPYYFAYDAAVRYAGGRIVTVPTSPESGFAPDPDEIGRRVTPRTKALLLLSPNNPTGTVYSRATLEGIAELARARDLLVVSDELYEKLIFDGAEHVSIASLPWMRERTVTINGFSKTYNMTGWRVGYLAGPAPIVRAVLQLKQNITICAPSIAQYAALAAMTGPQDCVRENLAVYDERRRAFVARLDAAGIPYLRPAGAFYVFADISRFGMTSVEFCERLLREQQVFIWPGVDFGACGEGFVRISLLAPLPTLLEAASRIERFVADQRAG